MVVTWVCVGTSKPIWCSVRISIELLVSVGYGLDEMSVLASDAYGDGRLERLRLHKVLGPGRLV